MHENDAQLHHGSVQTRSWPGPTWSLLQSFALAVMSLQGRCKVDTRSLESGRWRSPPVLHVLSDHQRRSQGFDHLGAAPSWAELGNETPLMLSCIVWDALGNRVEDLNLLTFRLACTCISSWWKKTKKDHFNIIHFHHQLLLFPLDISGVIESCFFKLVVVWALFLRATTPAILIK